MFYLEVCVKFIAFFRDPVIEQQDEDDWENGLHCDFRFVDIVDR